MENQQKKCSINAVLSFIREDAETIRSIALTERNPIFAMGILPYYSLFYTACAEFLNSVEGISYQSELTDEISIIRNHIKDSTDGFSKMCRRICEIDEMNDADFKSKIVFQFLRNPSFYYNLGISFDEDRHPVLNTQDVSSYILNDGEHNYDIAKEIGAFVNSICKGFSDSNINLNIERIRTSIRVPYYYDTNTHRPDPFFTSQYSLEYRLFFLKHLCKINFVIYLLRPLLSENNTWLFHIKYVALHHACIALQRFVNHEMSNGKQNDYVNEVNRVCKEAITFDNPELRNLMMHYQYPENNASSMIITQSESLYVLLNMCGITESITAYSKRMDKLLSDISNLLERHFDTQNIKLIQY